MKYSIAGNFFMMHSIYIHFFGKKAVFLLFLLSVSLLHAESFQSSQSNIVLRAGLGYGYSFYGIAWGSSFNVNPGSGPEVDAGFLYNYRFIGVDGNLKFTFIRNTNFGVQGEQFRTEGSGKMMLFDTKVGYYRALSRGTLHYAFLFGGLRYWNADYAYSRIGTAEYDYSDAMQGLGFTLGGRYATYFNIIDNWPFALHIGALISRSPLSSLERIGAKHNIKEQSGVTPGLELGFGILKNNQGLCILVLLNYDVIATKFKDVTEGERYFTAATGTTKISLTAIKNMEL